MGPDNIIDPRLAAGAYSNGLKVAGNATATDSGGDDGDSGSFANVLRGSLESSLGTLRGGEIASAEAVSGDADITEVVQAVTAAELTLETVVAIRDRLVSAYQEISRMPI